jgi:S-DNA-T family DNA segregation ATPase FtsK/SpoIIIE
VTLDFGAEPHVVVLGENECGKSNLLDLIIRGLCRRFSPEQARIVVVDYRRCLLDSVPGSHLLGYAASASPAEKLMAETGAALRKRLPGPDLRPVELRSRSWWTGPDLFVVVDDYELVATATGNPLAAIAEHIPQAADVGLHVVLARGFGGAGRAMHDPLIQRIRDMGNPGLIMSGSRDEGVLWSGVRGEPMPAGRGRFISRRAGVRLVQTALGQRSPVG